MEYRNISSVITFKYLSLDSMELKCSFLVKSIYFCLVCAFDEIMSINKSIEGKISVLVLRVLEDEVDLRLLDHSVDLVLVLVLSVALDDPSFHYPKPYHLHHVLLNSSITLKHLQLELVLSNF